jgi:hypothetical protein
MASPVDSFLGQPARALKMRTAGKTDIEMAAVEGLPRRHRSKQEPRGKPVFNRGNHRTTSSGSRYATVRLLRLDSMWSKNVSTASASISSRSNSATRPFLTSHTLALLSPQTRRPGVPPLQSSAVYLPWIPKLHKCHNLSRKIPFFLLVIWHDQLYEVY